MNIRGIYKTSLIDYPGKISTVLFTGGCNLRCKYCHNPALACNLPGLELTPNDEAISFIEKRSGLIDGVTITGGEPTLSPNISEFLKKLKNRSIPVKLDSNGLNPSVIERLVGEGLLDYVAIDVKTSPEKYRELTGSDVDFGKIYRSVSILRDSGVDYEIRTTCIPGYVTVDDFYGIGGAIGRVSSYYLQQFRKDTPLLDESCMELSPYTRETLLGFREIVLGFADFCIIRGI
ncbi:MAG: anaerobic ribonucleoside-triphosphate reductase activating protein [Spirochaetes bacterium]|jgi:pyruvate formate lyase activating enzyme|nr:anaerobic ribonucleoside-triphosphate reductase activating protein [Spirochaetota bacterium]